MRVWSFLFKKINQTYFLSWCFAPILSKKKTLTVGHLRQGDRLVSQLLREGRRGELSAPLLPLVTALFSILAVVTESLASFAAEMVASAIPCYVGDVPSHDSSVDEISRGYAVRCQLRSDDL